MKALKYQILQGQSEDGQPILIEKTMTWSEANEGIAKAEAYNGMFSIEDDGNFE